MRALVVLADTADDSFATTLAARAVDGLLAGGHTVDVLDLCAIGFRAAMSAAEWRAYAGEEPILDPMVAEHAAAVQRAELLVFVYPTRSTGLPAILKGWLERVLVPGVGFRLDERTGRVKPALPGVQTIVGISTYGATRMQVAMTGDDGRRTLTRALRLSCGIRTTTRWFGMYSTEESTEIERADFAGAVERAMLELR